MCKNASPPPLFLLFRHYFPLFLGPFLFVLIAFIPFLDPMSSDSRLVVAVVVWMVVWWVLEAIPIPFTALLPLILFPVLDIASIKSISAHYAHPIIFLFLGGFILAVTMEKWDLHRRIALYIVRAVGTSADRIIAGFMIATALLSMWISNTATAVMMLPMGIAVVRLLQDNGIIADSTAARNAGFSTALMLSIAYAANIGGTATLIGTPPNAILAAFLEERFDYSIGFAEWMMIGVPYSVVMLGLSWLLLVKLLFPNQLSDISQSRRLLEREICKLGPMTYEEKVVAIVFGTTALLWVLRDTINQLLSYFSVGMLSDTTIALAAAVVMALLPAGASHTKADGTRARILDWETAQSLPWGILLLFGGGLSIASALSHTDLVQQLGTVIAESPYGLMTVVVLTVTVMLLLTELMSNMALTSLLLPITAGIALSLSENPLLFTIPVTLAASSAFMLPVATPPNAIVFASGYISIKHMVYAGVILNLLSILLISVILLPLLIYSFDIEIGFLPEWASLLLSFS